jgi:ribosomal protein L19E
MEASAVEVRLRNHDARLESHHTAIGDLRAITARHDTKIEVISTELRETRDDMKEIRDEIKWIRRGMWTAAAALVGFMLTFGGLIVAIANG